MREIKFKAWDKINKKMLSWEEIWEQDLVRGIFEYDSDYIPLQYTGLKDFKGVDIYEGDNYINAEYPTEEDLKDVYTIFSFKGAFTGGKKLYNSSPICWNSEEDDDGFTEELQYTDTNWIKVTGNIYEGLKIDL